MAESAPKKPNGLQKIMQPSPELAAVIGNPKSCLVAMWFQKCGLYIKANNLTESYQ